MKNDTKIFAWTAFVSTSVLYTVELIKSPVSFSDLTLTIFYFFTHVFFAFIALLPLVFPFNYFDKKIRSLPLLVVGRTIICIIYIFPLLIILNFIYVLAGQKDPFSFYDNIKHLGNFALIGVTIFTALIYFSKRKDSSKADPSRPDHEKT